jgi:hypothetical protein
LPLHPFTVRAGSEDLSMASQIQYATVIQGYQDPVTAYIYNEAPYGSDPANYSVYAAFPYGMSGTYLGTRAADGGAGYDALPFTFDTSQTAPGSQHITVTATDRDTGGTLTQGGDVEVLAHGVPAFVIGGNVVQLGSRFVEQAPVEPWVEPLAFGATGGGEFFAASAPGIIDDPMAPTAELDLDSITAFGDPQITITLQPFTDHIASDDPANAVPFEIDVDASVPGTYFAEFELNYSDEQDLPGAFSPGSEHGYFAVEVTVTPDGVTGGIVVPEPRTLGIAATGMIAVAMRRKRPASRAKAERDEGQG